MVRETILLSVRGRVGGPQTTTHRVRITITGSDLLVMAKKFDREADALRKAGNHPRAALVDAHARQCRTGRKFQITMPAEVWKKTKGSL